MTAKRYVLAFVCIMLAEAAAPEAENNGASPHDAERPQEKT